VLANYLKYEDRQFDYKEYYENWTDFDRLSDVLGISLPPSIIRYKDEVWGYSPWKIDPKVSTEDGLRDVSHFMTELLEAAKAQKNISFHPALSQELLQTLPDNSLDAFFDINGGFAYSADRLLLMELALQKLKPGHSLFIYVDSSEDRVMVGKKRPLLFNYLKEQHTPWIRTYAAGRGWLSLNHGKVLIATKPKDGPVHWDLGLEPNSVTLVNGGEEETPSFVPRITFRKKNSVFVK
jgi:hypothetical protein